MALDASILMFTRDGFLGLSDCILEGSLPFYVSKSLDNGERMPIYLKSKDLISRDSSFMPKYGTDSVQELFLILEGVLCSKTTHF